LAKAASGANIALAASASASAGRLEGVDDDQTNLLECPDRGNEHRQIGRDVERT